MNEIEFTFDAYEDLITELVNEGLQPKQYDERIDDKTLLIRHDVDWSPRKARQIGQIEMKNGISSTYFFLISSPFYNPFNKKNRSIMQDLCEMGHEIGLHFSTHQYWSEKPESEELETKVQEELTALELILDKDIDIVSFHNPPRWILRKSFESFLSTYEPQFFDEIAYQADSGQRWREERPFERELAKPIQMLTHPVLWGEKDAFTTDRLREERDYLSSQILSHLERTNRMWDGTWGIRDI